MTYDEAVDVVREFEGAHVDAYICGSGKERVPVAVLSGLLMERQREDSLPTRVKEALIEPDAFAVGPDTGCYLTLWPHRFVDAKRIEAPSGIEIVTQDGVIEVYRKSRPWID